MGDPYDLSYFRQFPVSHEELSETPYGPTFKIPLQSHHYGLFRSVIWLTKGDIKQLNHFEPRGRNQASYGNRNRNFYLD